MEISGKGRDHRAYYVLSVSSNALSPLLSGDNLTETSWELAQFEIEKTLFSQTSVSKVENVFDQHLGPYWPALDPAFEKIPSTDSAAYLHSSQDSLVFSNLMFIKSRGWESRKPEVCFSIGILRKKNKQPNNFIDYSCWLCMIESRHRVKQL